MHIRIATRQSDLALWQAEHVASILKLRDDVKKVEKSLEKQINELDRSLQKIGGKGLFIKELEVAMQEDRADIAVHSMKDVPVDMPKGFCIGAVLKRASAADALIGSTLDELVEGATVGSSSLRRVAQIRLLRPDLHVEPLRGNVNTRLAKLVTGEFDAIILACAGLIRLEMAPRIRQSIHPDICLPAVGQGVLGIQCRENDPVVKALIAPLLES